ENDVDFEPDKLSRDLGEALVAALRPANLDRDGATLDPSEFAQPLYKSGDPLALDQRRGRTQEPNGWQLRRLLRARRERPHGCRTAEQRDELPSLQLNCIRPSQAGAGLHDIELARISQVITKRFYNLLAVGEGAHSPVGRERLEKQGHRSFASARRP